MQKYRGGDCAGGHDAIVSICFLECGFAPDKSMYILSRCKARTANRSLYMYVRSLVVAPMAALCCYACGKLVEAKLVCFFVSGFCLYACVHDARMVL